MLAEKTEKSGSSFLSPGLPGGGCFCPELEVRPGIRVPSPGTHPLGVTEVVSNRLLSHSNCTLVATLEGIVPHPKEVLGRPSITSPVQTQSPLSGTSSTSRPRVPFPDRVVLEREILRKRGCSEKVIDTLLLSRKPGRFTQSFGRSSLVGTKL